ncbi:type II toxin-antitoxin system Phd/YefM family antitoxin [Loigolactobacillus iwatensis]|uniref:type II toxin-antitoxin system Phd/YefM family antitoxin n=1 Tax=Loigolactobacillus iwatensis TaxID=1267156 RepID=UPI000F7E4295|nr:type II toxin-antitoxin system Phd/YefM family antitoxin [Loigolactobacillus iwatensis]
MKEINVTEAKAHLNRYVRDLDKTGSYLLVRNERTGAALLLISASQWQAQLEHFLPKELEATNYAK